jgi:hypothetical protein
VHDKGDLAHGLYPNVLVLSFDVEMDNAQRSRFKDKAIDIYKEFVSKTDILEVYFEDECNDCGRKLESFRTRTQKIVVDIKYYHCQCGL